MKKRVLLMVICMISSFSMFALGNPDAPLAASGISLVTKGSTVSLFYKAKETGKVRITILDKYSNEIYSEVLRKTKSFSRPYNLSQLPKGEYIIKVQDGDNTKEESIIVGYEPAEQIGFNVVRVANTKNKFLVTVGQYHHKNVRIRVYDADSNVLLDQNEKIGEDFAEVLNVERVSGKVSIQISADNGSSKTYNF
jgi:hypothetical protein